MGSATDAPAARLRGDLELLPAIAEAGLSRAAKDISQGGLVGTADDAGRMLAASASRSTSPRVPRPDGVPLERWLLTFPSFGYLLSVRAAERVGEVLARFAARGIAAAEIGVVTARAAWSTIGDGDGERDGLGFRARPLLGCGPRRGLGMTDRALRIAILAHSTNPRGGVVHALELGDALGRLGHEAVVHAPDASGRRIFPANTVRAPWRGGDRRSARRDRSMVETRIADYVRHFERAEHRAASMCSTLRTAFPPMRWQR